MSDDELKGIGKQVKGEAKKQWGKLTDDNKEILKGEKDKVTGKAQEKYGELKNDYKEDDE